MSFDVLISLTGDTIGSVFLLLSICLDIFEFSKWFLALS